MKSKIIFHDLKMEIPTARGEIARYYGDIVYIKYDKPYSIIYCADNTKYQVSESLKKLLNRLPGAFFLCNPRTIINIQYYREWTGKPNLMILMEDGEAINISFRRLKAFKEHKNNLTRISPPCQPCYTCPTDCESKASFCIRHKLKKKMTVSIQKHYSWYICITVGIRNRYTWYILAWK